MIASAMSVCTPTWPVTWAPNYCYRCELLSAIDGSTVRLRLDLGLCIFRNKVMRLTGLDSPRIGGPEPDRAMDGRLFILDWFGEHHGRILCETRPDCHAPPGSAWTADLIAPQPAPHPPQSLADELVRLGLATRRIEGPP